VEQPMKIFELSPILPSRRYPPGSDGSLQYKYVRSKAINPFWSRVEHEMRKLNS
jgi:hypothetical protein